MSETEYVMIRGKKSSIKWASQDSPIYKRGFVFGGIRLGRSSRIENQEAGLEGQKKEEEGQESKEEFENV